DAGPRLRAVLHDQAGGHRTRPRGGAQAPGGRRGVPRARERDRPGDASHRHAPPRGGVILPPRVLVIDDEKTLAETVEAFLRRHGSAVRAVPSAEAGLAALAELAPDVALIDLHLPGIDGLGALEAIQRERPETVAIMMTAYSSVSTAVAAMKAGAADYLTKPLDLEELWVVIQRAWEAHRLRGELAYLRHRAGHATPVESLLGASAPMVEVRQRIL